MEDFKDIWKQGTQEFILSFSATIQMGLKEEIEEDTTENPAVWVTDLTMARMIWKKTKPAGFLISKRDTQTRRVNWSTFIFWTSKEAVSFS